jgi:hypothetical protein
MSDMSGRLGLARARTRRYVLLARGHARFELSAVLLAVSLVAACLVTSKVDYDQAFIPSVVTRQPPSSEFERVPEEANEACKSIGNGDGYMLFTVDVSDLNREEDLQVRTLVNGKNVVPGGVVDANGKVVRDPFTFCIPANELLKPCNLLEVLVSSAFKQPTSYSQPKEDGDIAGVHWYVIGRASDNPASYLDCPGVPDAGVQ